MDTPKPSASYQGHRGACDQCSQRKVRCTPANGACQNCISWGKTCTYSPRIPSGRPRKKSSHASKDGNSTNARHNAESTPKGPSPVSPNCLRSPPQEVPPLTRSSASLSSMESQLITPPTEFNATTIPELDLSYATFQNGFYDDSSLYDHDYFSCSLTADQDMANPACTDFMFQYPAHYTDMSEPRQASDCKTHSSSTSSSLRHASQRAPSSFTMSRRDSIDTGPFTFTSLLNNVMDLRSKYDNLETYTVNHSAVGQLDSITTIDQAIGSVAQFLDSIEPYLSSTHRALGGSRSDAKRMQCNDLQKTMHLIVAGSSILVDAAYKLHELLLTLCRGESNGVSTRLNSVLRFSTVDFHVRRCIHSLSLVTNILSTEGFEALNLDNILHDLSGARSSGETLRQELAHAIEELKTPMF